MCFKEVAGTTGLLGFYASPVSLEFLDNLCGNLPISVWRVWSFGNEHVRNLLGICLRLGFDAAAASFQ